MDRKFAKLFAGAAAVALAASSVGSAVVAQDGAATRMGVSNTLQGNGWREELICSIKAQALASGEVS